MTSEFGLFYIPHNDHQYQNQNIEICENRGAFWSVFDSGERRYESRTPCSSAKEALKIGRISALKAEAQQERKPVVLEEGGVVIYQNYASLERFNFQIGTRFSNSQFSLQKEVDGICYRVFDP